MTWLCIIAASSACGGGDATHATPQDASEEEAFVGDAADAVDGSETTETGSCLACGSYAAPTLVGRVVEPRLTELSGLGASRAHPGVLYAHNDSGHPAEIFAIDAGSARTLGIFTLASAKNRDWEDIGVGPCGVPVGSCIYVADIGDNALGRVASGAYYDVYRLAEPEVAVDAPVGAVTIATVQKFSFEYDDGAPHNAETLLVHPFIPDALYVVTKPAPGAKGSVFKTTPPLLVGPRAKLVHVTDLEIPKAGEELTGGSIHPCGDRVMIRTYGTLYELRRAPTDPFEAVFHGTVVEMKAPDSGEAIEYRADGRGFFTAPEGASSPLSTAGCL